MRCDQIKAIQEALSGFLLEQVIDPKGTYYYDPQEFIPSNQTMKNQGCKKSQGHEYICDFIIYVHISCMHNLLKYWYIYSFIHFSVLFMYNARTEPYTYVYIWTYISSVEFVYKKLIETKKLN